MIQYECGVRVWGMTQSGGARAGCDPSAGCPGPGRCPGPGPGPLCVSDCCLCQSAMQCAAVRRVIQYAKWVSDVRRLINTSSTAHDDDARWLRLRSRSSLEWRWKWRHAMYCTVLWARAYCMACLAYVTSCRVVMALGGELN